MQNKYSILFVCLGNICRSPTAEGIFRAIIKREKVEHNFVIASCGTGAWHAGQPAHQDTQKIAKDRGVDLSPHRARQLQKKDFDNFNLIVAMDEKNRRDIRKLASSKTIQVVLLREYDPEPYELDVPDPYYGNGLEGFVDVFEIIERSCEQLFQELMNKI